MIDLSTLYNPQYEATTGRKRKVPVSEFILAQLPAMRKAYEDKAAYELEKEALEQEAAQFSEEMELAEESQREAEKQAAISTGINLATLGTTGGYLGHKLGWFGGKQPAEAAPATAAPVTTAAPAGAEAAGALAYDPFNYEAAAAGGGSSGMSLSSLALKSAGTAGVELAGRSIHDWAEEQGGAMGGTLELTARRAAQGAIIGGGPVGAGIGAAVGIVEGALTGGEGACMIVSACMGRGSFDVQVARLYRDRFVDRVTLRGYYMIAEWIVPWMTRYPALLRIVRRGLVDPLITYAIWRLSKDWMPFGAYLPGWYVRTVSRWFLRVCKRFGASRMCYIRSNGERV